MRNIWTNLAFSTAAGVASVLFVGSAVLAAEASNSNTGADSTNTASVSIENSTKISSTNNANIKNNISVTANTGKNSASENTGDGSVSSGDITGSVLVKNLGNNNGAFDSSIDLNCSGSCDFSASNSNTGADSRNDSSVSVKNNIDIAVTNNANVENNVGADLNTGENEADKNTGDGSVSSGDIDFSIEVVNDLNNNMIGAPIPVVPPVGPNKPPVAILPSVPLKPGEVLAAEEGLPVTGGPLSSWPLFLVVIGFALKILEKVSRKRFGGEIA